MEVSDTLYLVMEYIEGISLDEFLRKENDADGNYHDARGNTIAAVSNDPSESHRVDYDRLGQRTSMNDRAARYHLSTTLREMRDRVH